MMCDLLDQNFVDTNSFKTMKNQNRRTFIKNSILTGSAFAINNPVNFFGQDSIQPLKEIRIKLSLNSGTLQIIKAGLITAYSGILFALVSMTIRSHAIDIGG